jgi:hypothetical protein
VKSIRDVREVDQGRATKAISGEPPERFPRLSRAASRSALIETTLFARRDRKVTNTAKPVGAGLLANPICLIIMVRLTHRVRHRRNLRQLLQGRVVFAERVFTAALMQR